MTIDGIDARDFDDAVFAEPSAHGWRLLVAIADVSHYVQPDTPLDREARLRGTSVYFPDRVIPMLPEELSNGLCSLNPNVDRLCFVCEMTVTPRGEVTRSRFFDAVMRSHARLTYEEAAEILAESKPRSKHAQLKPALAHLNDVYEALRGARERRGAIDFDLHGNEDPARRARQGRERAPGPAARDAQDHRGMHDRGERRVRETHEEGADPRSLPRSRRPGGRASSRSCSCFCVPSDSSSAAPRRSRRRSSTGSSRRSRAGPRRSSIETVILRSLKQARYQPEQRGPLRPRARASTRTSRRRSAAIPTCSCIARFVS